MGTPRVSRFLLVAVVLCLTASTAWAGYPFVGPDPVKAGDLIWIADSYGSTNGGEFIIHPPLNATAFETFCVEKTEYITLGGTKFKVGGISTSAFYGGVGATGDPLSPDSAYLFYKFRQGTLSNYDYGTGAARIASANSLQYALWVLEGEQASTSDTQANAWISEATGKWIDTGPVRVLNLLKVDANDIPTGERAQDLLCIVPVPEPVFLQFGVLSGLGGFALWRRRR